MSEILPTQRNIRKLLTQGKDTRLHWFPADVAISQLANVLMGMANTDGGVIIIGVAPRAGYIQGIDDPAEVMDRIFQAALMVEPTLVLPVPQTVRVDEKLVVWVMVPRGLPSVYAIDGRYLHREGAQTVPLPARQLRRLLYERGIVQFESQMPIGASLMDLDDEKIAAYANIVHITSSESTEIILQRRGCLRTAEDGDGGLNPTYAALLLFGRSPQQWMPNATILAARFAGFTMADRFIKQDINGTLPEQLHQAEAFVRQNLPDQIVLNGLTHTKIGGYPIEAVRELLVNAVAHRDYNIQGDNIHLNIFSNRIEVHSPGGLPGPVNLENLLQARFSRNAVIVQVLADMGFVERLGYGLDRVVRVMRQHGLPAPRFEEFAGSFRVTLFAGADADIVTAPTAKDMSDYEALGLNTRQELALSYLLHSRRITNRDYQELCPDVHPETLRRDLADLVTRGIVIKVGDKRATYYILKK